ncbi:hypothetical protein [Collimonas fungivorans]|uniref:DUF1453 domain-containing protein n=1 Tax=Collimonas fungivorans (strain Ter331) TaxID=1005048 RepID=G0AEA7_COLFT|nr:hypothetical protein [Collimonas fungivorans]AEK64037.1 conserved hypothetical protein [Collimonas fungivorans Ter331]
MAIPAHPSLFVSLGIAALVVWRLYSRIRRMVGRQKLSNVRPWITICLFTWLMGVLSLASLAHADHLAAIAGGIALGIGLGIYGHRLTKFEQTPEGLFYTPSAHLGIALSLLFVGRIVYRLVQFYLAPGPQVWTPSQFSSSSLTLLIFGILAAYYVTYAIGLLRWRHGLRPGNAAPVAGPENT